MIDNIDPYIDLSFDDLLVHLGREYKIICSAGDRYERIVDALLVKLDGLPVDDKVLNRFRGLKGIVKFVQEQRKNGRHRLQ